MGDERVIHRLYAMLRLPNEQHQVWLKRRADEARAILNADWSVVMRLARALSEHGTLRGKGLRDLLRRRWRYCRCES